MKYENITLQTLVDTLKHQKKFFFLYLMVFAILGGIVGFLFSGQSSAPANGSADPLRTVNSSSIPRNNNYFNSYYSALSSAEKNVNDYLQILRSQPNLTKEQKSALQSYIQQVNDYEATYLSPISDTLNSYDVHILSEYIQDKISTLKQDIIQYEGYLMQAERAAEVLANIEAPRVSSESSDSAYARLLEQASQIGNYTRYLHIYRTQLNELENTPSLIKKNSSELEKKLNDATSILNDIISTVNDYAAFIALEHSLIFTIDYDENNIAIITTTHTHGEVSGTESFVIIALFTTLVGMCSGIVIAIAREARKKNTSPTTIAQEIPKA